MINRMYFYSEAIVNIFRDNNLKLSLTHLKKSF